MPNTTKIFQDRMFFLILTFRKKLTFCDKQQSLVDIIYTIELTLRAVLHLIHEGRVLHQIRRVSTNEHSLTPCIYDLYKFNENFDTAFNGDRARDAGTSIPTP